MRNHALGLIVVAMAASVPASAQDRASKAWVGDYTMSQMELVAGLRLNADGTFQYGLTVGSLDERAQGRWQVTGDRIVLTSDPRPKPPTVVVGKVVANPGEPFAIRLVGPVGKDVAGVDFRIDFGTGEPLTGYTSGAPWLLPKDEKRVPRFVTFAMKPYRLQSDRLPLDAQRGRTAMFELIPNDFGVADLTGSYAVRRGDTLTLYRDQGEMRFRRSKR